MTKPRPLLPAREVDAIKRLPGGTYKDFGGGLWLKASSSAENVVHVGDGPYTFDEATKLGGGFIERVDVFNGCRTCAGVSQVVMPPGGDEGTTHWYEPCPDCQEGEG